MTREETGLRVQALETASRLGLPHDMTLKAARAYLTFLQGKEPAPTDWALASHWAPLPAEIVKRAKQNLTALEAKKRAVIAKKKPVVAKKRAVIAKKKPVVAKRAR